MSDIFLDGKPIGTLVSLEVNHAEPAEPRPQIGEGPVFVTGSITAFFHSPTLMEEYIKRDLELEAFLRDLFDQPVPSPRRRLLRWGLWAATALVLLTLSKGAI